MKKISMTFFVALAFGAFACAQNKAEPEAAKPATQPAPKAEAAAPAAKPAPANGVRFVALKDGAKVGTELKVNFAVTGKTVRPAGEDPEDKATGHHHVIIDGQAMAAGTVIPMDATHKHYGKGQTEATLQLTPGEHTLTLHLPTVRIALTDLNGRKPLKSSWQKQRPRPLLKFSPSLQRRSS